MPIISKAVLTECAQVVTFVVARNHW